MGTNWSVKISANRDAVPGLQPGIQRVLDDIVTQMSHWQPDSHLSRYNGAAAGTWHVLPEAFWQVMTAGVDIARETAGAFDPTSGALIDAWGFGPDAHHAVPSADVIRQAREACGWHKLQWDEPRRALWQPGGIRLDLSGIAKGFAVDAVSTFLVEQDVRDHLIDIGGELRGTGRRPDGSPWRVAVQGPVAIENPSGIIVPLGNQAVATSGDYLRFFEQAGKRFSHTIDPRLGRPVPDDVASVTVAHAQCMLADAYATALTVMGADKGFEFACSSELAALFLIRRAAEAGQPSGIEVDVKPTPAFIALAQGA